MAEIQTQSPTQSAGRALPEDNLAYPVRVELTGSQGSGFFLNAETATYFVTAKHVLINPQTGKFFDSSLKLESFSRDLSDPRANDILVDLNVAETKIHPKEDVVAVKIGELKRNEGNPSAFVNVTLKGVTIAQAAEKGIVGLSKTDTVRKFDEVKVSNDVYVFGFPNSIGLEQIPQVDSKRPLLRKGIVAGLNRSKRTIIIDCETFPGNSGGLVLEVEREPFQNRFHAIGLILEYVPFDNARLHLPLAYPTVLNSGYSVVLPMDAVLDLVGD